MGYFEFLPEVDTCCFCIPLYWGCIIISICGILSMGSAGLVYGGTYMGHSLASVLEIFQYVAIFAQLLFFIASILLLIGILMELEWTIPLWLVACLINVIVLIIYAILACPIFYAHGAAVGGQAWSSTITFLITPAIWIYFMCVVNSQS